MALGPTIADSLRSARREHGFDESFCAAEAGLSPASYRELESDESLFFDAISLGTARRLCALFGLDLLDLTARRLNILVRERRPAPNIQFHARNALVAAARQRRNLSERMLADAIGFDPIAVHELEATPDYIETLPIRVVLDLAAALGLDPGTLICNRSSG